MSGNGERIRLTRQASTARTVLMVFVSIEPAEDRPAGRTGGAPKRHYDARNRRARAVTSFPSSAILLACFLI